MLLFPFGTRAHIYLGHSLWEWTSWYSYPQARWTRSSGLSSIQLDVVLAGLCRNSFPMRVVNWNQKLNQLWKKIELHDTTKYNHEMVNWWENRRWILRVFIFTSEKRYFKEFNYLTLAKYFIDRLKKILCKSHIPHLYKHIANL